MPCGLKKKVAYKIHTYKLFNPLEAIAPAGKSISFAVALDIIKQMDRLRRSLNNEHLKQHCRASFPRNKMNDMGAGDPEQFSASLHLQKVCNVSVQSQRAQN